MVITPILLALAVAPQATWYVDASAPGPGTGTLADPYKRVDYAAARPDTESGDTLLVGPGVYPAESIELSSKEIVFTATSGAAQTILEGPAQGSIVRLTGTGAPEAILQGFTFRRGRGTVDPVTGSTYGGAVYAETGGVTLRDCVFTDCRADFGGAVAGRRPGGSQLGALTIDTCSTGPGCIAQVDGGVIHMDGWVNVSGSSLTGIATAGRGGVAHVSNGQLTARDSALEGFAAMEGGALYVVDRSVALRNCTVEGTSGGNGGALCAERTSIQLVDSSFTGSSLSGGFGGGVYVSDSIFNQVERCRFAGCQAHSGGAIYSSIFGTLFIDGAEFRENVALGSVAAPGRGGAIFCDRTFILAKGLFVRNSATGQFGSAGGAIYGTGILTESTFVNNRASAEGASVVNGPPGTVISSARTANCIFTGSLVGGVPHVEGLAPVSRSVIEGGAPGNMIIDADPSFWGNADFHLLPDSPARRRNSGFNAGVYLFDPSWCGQNCDGPLGVVACTAAPNSTGLPAELSGLGSFDPLVDRLVLRVFGLRPGSVGVLIASQTPGFAPMAGGDGNLCLSGSILRFQGSYVAGSNGSFSLRPVLSSFPGGLSVQAGESWYFQVWYRDGGTGGPTSNFTPSLLVAY